MVATYDPLLRVEVRKSKNMDKNRRKVTRKGRLVLNPQGSVRSKRDVQNFWCPPQKS